MNILIVGCGLAGVTYARLLADAGHNITIIDQRNHIAGNAFDYLLDGIRIHKYGIHVFHTNNLDVVNWLSKFTEWIKYKHIVKALYNDKYYPIPINKESLNEFGLDECINIFFKRYSEKMWGIQYDKIPQNVIQRLPIKNDYNPYYFPKDRFQGLPKEGYTKMVEKILDHKNIAVNLTTSFTSNLEDNFDFIFNSMSIDEYYKNIHGELPYRSIKYEITKTDKVKFPVAQVNFTTITGPTRAIEWKNLPYNQSTAVNYITYETPCDFKENNNERYYPITQPYAKNIYQKYNKISHKKMNFIGRCGTYQYLNMDQVINQSIIGATKWLAK